MNLCRSIYLSLEAIFSSLSLLFLRRVNVTQFGDKAQCFSPVSPQKYYIVFAEMRANQLVAKYDDLFGAAADWTQQSEERVWSGVGKFWNFLVLFNGLAGNCGGKKRDPGVMGMTELEVHLSFVTP